MTESEESRLSMPSNSVDIKPTEEDRVEPDRAAALVVDADESLEDDPFQAFIDIREESEESSQIRGTIVNALNASLLSMSVSESRENFLAEFAAPSATSVAGKNAT